MHGLKRSPVLAARNRPKKWDSSGCMQVYTDKSELLKVKTISPFLVRNVDLRIWLIQKNIHIQSENEILAMGFKAKLSFKMEKDTFWIWNGAKKMIIYIF